MSKVTVMKDSFHVPGSQLTLLPSQLMNKYKWSESSLIFTSKATLMKVAFYVPGSKLTSLYNQLMKRDKWSESSLILSKVFINPPMVSYKLGEAALPCCNGIYHFHHILPVVG
jgi:hypothetical protein